MSIIRITRGLGAAAVAVATLAGASCGEVARTGQSPVYLIIVGLEGGDDAESGTTLNSDVQTIVDGVPSFFNDPGEVTFRLGLKNPGLPTGSLGPSTLNSVTVNRYRVVYLRADGRSTPGVDVPYPFDGAFTVTVSGEGTTSAGFDLVRHQAKLEAPLRNLVGLGGSLILSTIAEVTFFGRDQAGNEVMATGNISVNFGDFGDPQ